MKSLSFPKGICRKPFTQMKPQSPGASLLRSNLHGCMQFCLSFQKMLLKVNLGCIWAFTRGLPQFTQRLPSLPIYPPASRVYTAALQSRLGHGGPACTSHPTSAFSCFQLVISKA